MKKNFYTLIILISTLILFAYPLKAQIKIHDDNHVSIGTISNTGDGLHLKPLKKIKHSAPLVLEYDWMYESVSAHVRAKHFIVSMPLNGHNHQFFVYGNGAAYGKIFLNNWGETYDKPIYDKTSE